MSTTLSKFVSIRNKGKRNIRKHIWEINNHVMRLSALKLQLSDGVLVYLVLNSLST